MRRPAPGTARTALAVAVLALVAVTPPSLGAQQPRPALPPSAQQAAERIRQEQEELQRLRAERQQLESRMRQLQSTARDVAAERENLERQVRATAQVVRSLDAQLASLLAEVRNVNASLVRTQDELRQKRAALRRRAQDIYKRGPLYTLEALLSAESFGSLVARYKYLNLVARRDRALVQRVEILDRQITGQRAMLVRLQTDMEANRRQQADEMDRLRRLELQRGRTLAQLQTQARQAEERLRQIARDEERVAGIIAALEESRRRAATRPGAAPTASAITTADLGRLDWPVEGTILYRFGRVRNPNNTAITWNGMGIGAELGAPVRSIAAGEVAVAEALGTYGATVLIEHGGGMYSMYASLQRLDVKRGDKVTKGQVIGTVGQSDPDMPPRLHLEIRPGGRAVDPLEWLRRQR